MRRFFARLVNLVRPGRAERDLEREVASHLSLIEEDLMRRGMTPEAARTASRRTYGGVEQAKELHRDARSFVWMEQVLQDARHACRGLWKSPGFVAVAMLSLAFGIGVNAAIFTLVNGILLKKLPVPEPERVVQVSAKLKEFESNGFNYPAYRALSRQPAIFSDTIAFSGRRSNLELDGEPHPIDFELVTGGFFRFFGARPALGRLIDDEDDRAEGAHPVCVLSYNAWQTHFGGNPAVLGRSIRIGSIPLQVIGVAAPEFVGPELQRRFDVWAPSAMAGSFGSQRENGNTIWLHILARLRTGIPMAEAQARLAGVSRAIEDSLPPDRANHGAVYRVRDASKGYDSWRSTLQDPLYILMGAVTLVLLVACANLANLLLARAGERRQEFAIKLSLGISRWRLLRQLLIETFVLAFAGGAAALALAAALTRVLLAIFNSGSQYQSLHVAPDRSVFLFTFAACVCTALLAGLYPAWQAARTDAAAGLKGGALQGPRRALVRRGLILVQVTLAVVLLFGASLFTHSLSNLKVVNLGYDIDRVLSVAIAQRGPVGSTPQVIAPHALAEVLARVRQLPGVEAAAFSEPGPLTGQMMSTDLTLPDPSGGTRRADNVHVMFIGPGYLPAMRMVLVRGRDFTAADGPAAPGVAIVNQRLASLLWPGQDPIGKHFPGWGIKDLEIVGVAGDSNYKNVREAKVSIFYQSFDQSKIRGGVLAVRCRGAAAAVERQVREVVKTSAPDYQVSNATSMELLRDQWLAQDRLLAFLSTLFGTLGTVLALVGIYGLISYSVTRRTREIGIRISIGAQRGNVLWLFLRESLLLIAGGMLLGLPLALVLARFLKKMLFQVSVADPLGIAATLILLAAGGLIASCAPARRATKIDPVRALRYD